MIGSATFSLWTVEITFSHASVVITDPEYVKRMKLASELSSVPLRLSDGDIRNWVRDAAIDLIQRPDSTGNLIVRLSDGRGFVVKPGPYLADQPLDEWVRNLLHPSRKPN
jgi:hypothetical protein